MYKLQIEGELNLLDVITLAGSFTITASVDANGGQVEIKGFVSANIDFLGGVSGTIALTARVDTVNPEDNGIWGAAELVLASNGVIPGVSLNGTFFIELNISGSDKTF